MDGDTSGTAQFDIRLRIGNRGVRLRGEITREPIRVTDLLPALYPLAGAIVDSVIEEVEQTGKRISCRAGCGACCRQLVPVSEAEVVRLAELLDTLPPEKRKTIRKRCAEAIERVEQAGLLARLERFDEEVADKATRRELGLAYFALKIPCPFLENESCGIYADRPMLCREYLVMSPPEHCAQPETSRAAVIEMPRRLSTILFKAGHESGEGKARYVPLILIPQWFAQHRDQPLPKFPGHQLLADIVRRLAGSGDSRERRTEDG